MWKLSRFVFSNTKVSLKFLQKNKYYSTSNTTKSHKKMFFGIITFSSLISAGTIIYANYDPEIKRFLETNVPYINKIFEILPADIDNLSLTLAYEFKEKMLQYLDKTKLMISSAKKQQNNNSSTANDHKMSEEQSNASNKNKQFEKDVDKVSAITTEKKVTEDTLTSPEVKENATSYEYENDLNKTILQLKSIFEETISAHKFAANAIKYHHDKLFEALKFSYDDNNDAIWKEVNDASVQRDEAMNIAHMKAENLRLAIENLKSIIRTLSENNACNSIIKNGEELAIKYSTDLQKAEDEIKAAEEEARTTNEFEKILKISTEHFEKELQLITSNKLKGKKEIPIASNDLKLLLVHAYNKIKYLQKEIAKLQASEKIKIEDAVMNQKLQDDVLAECKIQNEKQRCRLEIEKTLEDYVTSLKSDCEAQIHKQLLRQIAVHVDHLQQVLELQEKEFKQKIQFEIEEKLFRQKESFILEISRNISRLKEIAGYLQTKNESDKSIEKIKALWLISQAMNYKIATENLCPLAEYIEKLKTVADEDNDFVHSVITIIPTTALKRGVFTSTMLEKRFENVKQTCKKVALIDQKNDSLYRYVLSYLQSFLLIDTEPKSNEFLNGNNAAEASKWDTFDLLQRISYFLNLHDLEQALSYANELTGEPRVVAEDWINELTLLLETQLVLKALFAHAVAISVQAYH